MDDTPRLRMFAGPNGSGKSTLKADLKPEWLGFYVNADEIQERLTSNGYDISSFPFTLTQSAVDRFWEVSSILPEAERGNRPRIDGGRLFLDSLQASYGAAAVSELLRENLLAARASFTFETVMSHESKIDLMREAQLVGYRTYLYFICTEDPVINRARIEARVNAGGHPVPLEKIESRYDRALELLPKAIQASNRAYLFDNSRENEKKVLIAEFTDGNRMTIQVDEGELPSWFTNSIGGRIQASPEP